MDAMHGSWTFRTIACVLLLALGAGSAASWDEVLMIPPEPIAQSPPEQIYATPTSGQLGPRFGSRRGRLADRLSWILHDEPPVASDFPRLSGLRERLGASGARLRDGLDETLEWIEPTVPAMPPWADSWIYRPWSVGMDFGFIAGGDLIQGRASQGVGPCVGLRVGREISAQWGAELRGTYTSISVGGVVPNNNLFLGEAILFYYPQGDAPARPYFLWGLGLASFSFEDRLAVTHDKVLLTMPFGIGMKYRWDSSWAVRMEMTDHLSFGTGPMSNVHNLSFTVGLEYRFGRSRRIHGPPISYGPWNASHGAGW